MRKENESLHNYALRLGYYLTLELDNQCFIALSKDFKINGDVVSVSGIEETFDSIEDVGKFLIIKEKDNNRNK